ncbi:heme binding [Mortierella sp. GBA43]|nr:heme binding [Mortierella sp. GBA43]
MSSVVLETSMGDVTIELYTEHAPKTCKNFSELAKRGYYDGVTVSWFKVVIPQALDEEDPPFMGMSLRLCGLGVVDKLGLVATNASGKPTTEVKIIRARVE